LQGFPVAEWEPLRGERRTAECSVPRALKVVTTNLLEGWLRKNGIPYSDQTRLLE
jgi:hypothetical protein